MNSSTRKSAAESEGPVEEGWVSARKRTVDAYFDGFRASDHEAILALLSDEVVWVIHGHGRTEGKEAFDREIENDAFEGRPKLTVERLIKEGDTIVAPHLGEGQLPGRGRFQVRRSDRVLLRRGTDLARRVLHRPPARLARREVKHVATRSEDGIATLWITGPSRVLRTDNVPRVRDGYIRLLEPINPQVVVPFVVVSA